LTIATIAKRSVVASQRYVETLITVCDALERPLIGLIMNIFTTVFSSDDCYVECVVWQSERRRSVVYIRFQTDVSIAVRLWNLRYASFKVSKMSEFDRP